MSPPQTSVAKAVPVKATPAQVAVYFEERTVIAQVPRFPAATSASSDAATAGDSVALPINLDSYRNAGPRARGYGVSCTEFAADEIFGSPPAPPASERAGWFAEFKAARGTWTSSVCQPTTGGVLARLGHGLGARTAWVENRPQFAHYPLPPPWPQQDVFDGVQFAAGPPAYHDVNTVCSVRCPACWQRRCPRTNRVGYRPHEHHLCRPGHLEAKARDPARTVLRTIFAVSFWTEACFVRCVQLHVSRTSVPSGLRAPQPYGELPVRWGKT